MVFTIRLGQRLGSCSVSVSSRIENVSVSSRTKFPTSRVSSRTKFPTSRVSSRTKFPTSRVSSRSRLKRSRAHPWLPACLTCVLLAISVFVKESYIVQCTNCRCESNTSESLTAGSCSDDFNSFHFWRILPDIIDDKSVMSACGDWLASTLVISSNNQTHPNPNQTNSQTHPHPNQTNSSSQQPPPLHSAVIGDSVAQPLHSHADLLPDSNHNIRENKQSTYFDGLAGLCPAGLCWAVGCAKPVCAVLNVT